MNIKPGPKSSEFWLVVILDVLCIYGLMSGKIGPESTAAVLQMLGIMNGGYAVARGIAKRGS